MDWMDVEMQLRARAEEVARHLLPNGKREGAEWVCGNIQGQPGRSLKVALTGKAGLWSDFAGEGGGKTLMSLWCAVRGVEFRQAIREAKEFLGIRDDFAQRVKNYPPPAAASEVPQGSWTVAAQWKACQPLEEGGPVWKYLVEERRLAPEIVRLYDVRELIVKARWVMVFPYYGNDAEGEVMGGEPAWLKFEALNRVSGKKVEWTTYSPEKCLWGKPVARHPAFAKCRDVLICEGEKDAMTWATYGAGAWGVVPVSVPFGAKWKGQDKTRPSPNREWLDRDWEWLQGFETVYVAMDGDEAGRRAAADIIAEVGPRRCRLVEMPERQ